MLPLTAVLNTLIDSIGLDLSILEDIKVSIPIEELFCK